MILLNTKFNVDKALDRRALYELAVSWMNTSEHYNLALDSYDWQDEDWQIESDDGRQKAVVNNYPDRFVLQFIMVDGEESITYITTYVLDDVDTHSMHFLHERTLAQASFMDPECKVHIPNVYKDIFWHEYNGDDNGLLVDYKPYILRRSDVELAKRIIQCTGSFQNPVVYVSSNSFGYYSINCDYVAHALMGQAHVVVEGSPVVASAVGKATDKANPFNGSIRIYTPDGGSTLILPKGKFTGDEVISTVRRLLSGVAIDDSFDAVKIRQMHMFAKFSRDDDFSRLCEDMINDKDAEIAHLKEELNSVKQQLMVSRAKAENLQNSFDKSDTAGNSVALQVTESNLYDGELKTIVLKVLNKELESIRYDPNMSVSRKCDVLKDIMEHNSVNTTEAELIECFKNAFNDGVLTREGIGRLQASGFTVEKDGRASHYKVMLGDDDRYSCIVSNTPSDKSRSLKNSVSEFSNVLFGY